MVKFMKYLLLVPFVYIMIGTLLYAYQRDVLYYPRVQTTEVYKNIQFKNDNEVINVVYGNKGKEKAIIYFGGNAESAALSASYIIEHYKEYTVYLLDYRGFGRSTGTPTQEGLFKDALSLYDLIKDNHTEIIVSGRSLGSGIASYLASQRPIEKLVLITPYDSILEVAKDRYYIFPVEYLLKDTYKTIDIVKDIKAKTYIVTAENDTVVPKINSDRLINSFPKEQIIVKEISNRNHIDISQDSNYRKYMMDFVSMELHWIQLI